MSSDTGVEESCQLSELLATRNQPEMGVHDVPTKTMHAKICHDLKI